VFDRTTSTLGVLCAFAARPVEYPFHRSVIFTFTVLFHGASPVEYRLDQDRVVRPKRYSTGQGIFYPIFSSSRQACPETFRCQDKLHRRDAKTAKNEILISNIETRNNIEILSSQTAIVKARLFMTFVFLSFAFVSNFGFRFSVLPWRPLPRGIPTRPKSSCSPEVLFHGESHSLSDSLNQNLTENFKYLWLGFSPAGLCFKEPLQRLADLWVPYGAELFLIQSGF